jgi:hypothetical protein
MNGMAIESAVPARALFGVCPLRSHQEGVMCRIDVAAGTAEVRTIFLAAFERVTRVLSGERPTNAVNPEVLDRLAPAAP